MEKIYGKCYYCEKDFELDDIVGQTVCPHCGEKLDKERCAKYFLSLKNEQSEQKKVAHGEDYHSLELSLYKVDFYLNAMDFEKAEEEIAKAESYSNTDYRVWLCKARLASKNMTDYDNTDYKEYLDKAIGHADEGGKEEIGKLFKDYIAKCGMSEEERAKINADEHRVSKEMIELSLKELIGKFARKQKSIKNYLATWISCVIILTLLTVVYFTALSQNYVIITAAVVAIATYYFFRRWFVTRRSVEIFNAVIDVYDGLETFCIDEDKSYLIIDGLNDLCQKLYDNESMTSVEESFTLLCLTLSAIKSDSVQQFIESHKSIKNNI